MNGGAAGGEISRSHKGALARGYSAGNGTLGQLGTLVEYRVHHFLGGDLTLAKLSEEYDDTPRLLKHRCRMLERGFEVTPLGPGFC